MNSKALSYCDKGKTAVNGGMNESAVKTPNVNLASRPLTSFVPLSYSYNLWAFSCVGNENATQDSCKDKMT